MKFLEKIEKLQNLEENKNKIVIAKCGVFLVGIGKDAIILNSLFNLKLTCIKEGNCRAGIPINAVEKYVKMLENSGYGYIVYDYDKDTKEYKIMYDKLGTKDIKEKRKCLECNECDYYKTHKTMDLNEFFRRKKEDEQNK